MDATWIDAMGALMIENPAFIWPVGAGGFAWLVWKFSPGRSRDPVDRMENGFAQLEATCSRIEKQLEKIATEQELARSERAALANRTTALETALQYLSKGG